MWRSLRTVALFLGLGLTFGLLARSSAKWGDPPESDDEPRTALPASPPSPTTTAPGSFSPAIAASAGTAEPASGPFADIFNAHVVWEVDGEGKLHPQWVPDFAMQVPLRLNAAQARAALAMLEDEDRLIAGHFILASLMPETEVATELWKGNDRIDRYHCDYLGLMLDIEVHHSWNPPRRRMMLRNFSRQREALRAFWTDELEARGLLEAGPLRLEARSQ